MKLSVNELQWIDKRMQRYSIKYQEVYDEVSDQIITAIEAARANGDERNIEIVFQQIVDTNFGGYLGIDEVAITYEKAYRSKIEKAMTANYSYYINWQTLLFLLALTITGFYLPRGKTMAIIMGIVLLLTAIFPIIYAYTQSFKIKTRKGKRSIVKAYVLTRSLIMLILLNSSILQLLGFTKNQLHVALNPIFILFFYLILFPLSVIYGLSIMRLCKQEFKIAG